MIAFSTDDIVLIPWYYVTSATLLRKGQDSSQLHLQYYYYIISIAGWKTKHCSMCDAHNTKNKRHTHTHTHTCALEKEKIYSRQNFSFLWGTLYCSSNNRTPALVKKIFFSLKYRNLIVRQVKRKVYYKQFIGITVTNMICQHVLDNRFLKNLFI